MGVAVTNGQYCHICRNGHPLSYSNSSANYFSGSFSCDYCHNSFPCGVGRYNCTSCKFDVCNQCAATFKPRPMPIHNCKSGHPLVYTRIEASSASYTCDLCQRQGVCSLGRWNCAVCQYDVCGFCRLPPMSSPCSTPSHTPNHYPVMNHHHHTPAACSSPSHSPHMRTHCPNGHYLYQTTHSVGYVGGKFCCNQCHQGGYCSTGRFCCQMCKFDLCKLCKPC